MRSSSRIYGESGDESKRLIFYSNESFFTVTEDQKWQPLKNKPLIYEGHRNARDVTKNNFT